MGEWYPLVDQPDGTVTHGMCPECEAEHFPQEVRALMILYRDGSFFDAAKLAYLPAYRITTWCCLQPGEVPKKMNGTIQWTAPFDEHRFTVPMWVQEWAAANGVVIR
jgi:hypothetical protein